MVSGWRGRDPDARASLTQANKRPNELRRALGYASVYVGIIMSQNDSGIAWWYLALILLGAGLLFAVATSCQRRARLRRNRVTRRHRATARPEWTTYASGRRVLVMTPDRRAASDFTMRARAFGP